jgi:hypothetical protein
MWVRICWSGWNSSKAAEWPASGKVYIRFVGAAQVPVPLVGQVAPGGELVPAFQQIDRHVEPRCVAPEVDPLDLWVHHRVQVREPAKDGDLLHRLYSVPRTPSGPTVRKFADVRWSYAAGGV